MISRRKFGLSLLAGSTISGPTLTFADPTDPVVGLDMRFEQLQLPSIESLDAAEPFGYAPATAAEREKARKIIDDTPKGPTAFHIAKSFITRFAKADPEAISQWPAPKTWNPLVKEFFSATSLRANNDMVDWCAAFANWCIERNNKKGTNSAASQSFVTSGLFKKTQQPEQGNLVVFTCYEKESGKNLGLGHVAFFEEFVDQNKVRVLGGNQSIDGHSSIISERMYLTTPFDVYRHVGGKYVPCVYKLNSFLVVA